MKKKLYAFGDSFTFNEIEYSTVLKKFPEISKNVKHSSVELDCLTEDCFNNVNEWLDYKHIANTNSFIGLFAKKYDYELEVHAFPGSSNIHQFLKLYELIGLGNIKPNDRIFFGLTSIFRDNNEIRLKHNHNIERYKNILNIYYTLLSSLCHLSTQFKLVVMNAFNNPITFIEVNDNFYRDKEKYKNLQQIYNPNFFVGWNTVSNTMLDAVIDNYGNADVDSTIENFLAAKYDIGSSHSKINLNQYLTFVNKVSKQNEYKELFQPRMHPTFEGHKKIFKVFDEVVQKEHKYFIE